jgi:hypothetical protein
MSSTSGLDAVEQRKIKGTGTMKKKDEVTTDSLDKYINLLHMEQHQR